ncbi:MAG: tRNA (adenosine(37)-N6)-threonylcarbamoyltransferase complex ATPase subunit type 1 TsaE [Firmicutes bacterium]|nr:tRNA (adenosine(37)-N6)-threonylcarbamoyltransferase complex ATPase subunit type 1 TsaE [Bacillota bacterium]
MIISTKPSDTMRIGKELALTLPSGAVVALSGDLGAGKTVFSKGVALALGIKDEVTSPTFTLVKSYRGKDKILHHFDAYRLSDEEEAEECGLNELIGEPDSICVIEWPERIRGLLPESTVWVEIRRIDDKKREIKVRSKEMKVRSKK